MFKKYKDALLAPVWVITDVKKEKLAGEYGMVMTENLGRRLSEMCNLSDVIEAKGEAKKCAEILVGLISQNVSREIILNLGYSGEEYEKAVAALQI